MNQLTIRLNFEIAFYLNQILNPKSILSSFSWFAIYKSVLTKNNSSWVSKLFGTPDLANTAKDLVTGKPKIITLCVYSWKSVIEKWKFESASKQIWHFVFLENNLYFHNFNSVLTILLRDRQAGGYDFCKLAGVISSRGA